MVVHSHSETLNFDSGPAADNEDIAGSLNHKRPPIQECASQFGASYTRPHAFVGMTPRMTTSVDSAI